MKGFSLTLDSTISLITQYKQLGIIWNMKKRGDELTMQRKRTHKKLVDSKLKAYEKFIELEAAAFYWVRSVAGND